MQFFIALDYLRAGRVEVGRWRRNGAPRDAMSLDGRAKSGEAPRDKQSRLSLLFQGLTALGRRVRFPPPSLFSFTKAATYVAAFVVCNTRPAPRPKLPLFTAGTAQRLCFVSPPVNPVHGSRPTRPGDPSRRARLSQRCFDVVTSQAPSVLPDAATSDPGRAAFRTAATTTVKSPRARKAQRHSPFLPLRNPTRRTHQSCVGFWRGAT